MSYVSREIHTSQCHCTVITTTFRCNCHSAYQIKLVQLKMCPKKYAFQLQIQHYVFGSWEKSISQSNKLFYSAPKR